MRAIFNPEEKMKLGSGAGVIEENIN